MPQEEARCQCESRLCDHLPLPCNRPVSGYVKMAFVEDTCTNCAANMCVSGGQTYIYTTEEWDAILTKRASQRPDKGQDRQ